MAAALAQMLVAPEFLFRVVESTPEPAHTGTLQLDAYSRAARLSFFLWNATPDSESEAGFPYPLHVEFFKADSFGLGEPE